VTRILGLVGAAGGVGTTRLAVECGVALARARREVAVVEAAFATQGLAAYLDAPIGPDATALATDEATLAEALYEGPAGVTLCPAVAPFEQLARAKRPAAAERLGDRIAAAALAHDTVVVDIPPVAANQAVAAIEVADRLGVVTRDTHRGMRALSRQRDRLAEVGAGPDAVLANRVGNPQDRPVSEGSESSSVHVVPESSVCGPADCPAPPGPFTDAVAGAVEELCGVSLDTDTEGRGVFDRLVGS